MKILPKRWWIVAGGAAFGAVAVLTWFARSREFELVPLVIGVAVGALVGLAIVASYAGRDTAFAELRAQHPDAVVVAVRRDDVTASVLGTLSDAPGPVSLRSYVMVVILRDGIGWWRGRPSEGQLAFVPWSHVDTLELGPEYVGRSRSDVSFARLRVVVRDRDGALPTMLLGVFQEDALGVKYLTEDSLLELLDRMRVIRGGAASQRKAVSHASSGLVPGTTAHDAARIGPISTSAVPWVAQIVGFAGAVIAVVVKQYAIGFSMLGIGFLIGVAYFLLLVREGRALKREEAAGYTTKNGHKLMLEQRHPVTGAVIRHAGERALTKQEFADRLR
ncbi:hypothetical protein [Schumannella luteola]